LTDCFVCSPRRVESAFVSCLRAVWYSLALKVVVSKVLSQSCVI